MNTIPNLDAMTPDELWAFWSKYHRQGFKVSRELIGDKRKGYTVLAAKLASYACNKAVAMKARLDGQIVTAQFYEGMCERIYKELPEDLKW